MPTYGVYANQMMACHTSVMNLCAEADGTKKILKVHFNIFL